MTTQLTMFYGVGERNRILAAMTENHSIYITTLRSFAYEIASKTGSVTIDAVRALAVERDFPLPKEIGADERIFGCVLSRCKDFVCTGQRLSSRPERVKQSGPGASYISVYVLKTSHAAACGNAARPTPFRDARQTFQSETTTAQTVAVS